MNESRVHSHQCKHVMDMGESSTTRRAKSHVSCKEVLAEDQERPFKKARYVWQLKGKYHLKSSTAQIKTPRSQLYHERKSEHSSSDTDSDLESIPNEKLPKPIIKQISTDTYLLDHNAVMSIENQNPALDELHELNMLNEQSEEEYLRRWQTRQLAKGCVDNTINSLLELWKIAPIDSDTIEDLENEEQVEDDGILMAIQSHGLQIGMHNMNDNTDEGSSGLKESCEERENFSHLDNVSNINETVEGDNCFLNAAVSVAIKKKGLSSFSYRHIMVQMESAISGHTFNKIRERLVDKLEVIRLDPFVNKEVVYREKKRVRSMKF